MGFRVGNCDCRQRNHSVHGCADKKDLAGATVWLFVEGDFKVVGRNGAAGKDEVSIWSGEDTTESAQDAEAKGRPVTEEIISVESGGFKAFNSRKVRLV